jgi:3-hydroxyisobutyrate dehydrogenase
VEAVVEHGAVAAGSLAELAQQATAVGICVPADAHVRSVLAGEGGLLEHLRPGSVVAIHSTIAAETIDWAEGAASSAGVRIIEACLTGGTRSAENGSTTFLLGGEPEDFEPFDAMFEACGEVRVHAGPLGSASRLKLCLNLQTYVTHAGVAEAVGLARGYGLDLAGLKQAMGANGQLGPVVGAYFSLHETPRELLEDPGILAFRTAQQSIVAKDMDLMMAAAAELGLDVSMLEGASRSFERTYLLPRPGSPSATSPPLPPPRDAG